MGFIAGVISPSGAGGGGGVTAPTLDVGLTLVSEEKEIEFEIQNNDALNPAVVEIAFPQTALQATEWDDGTATSPSFAIDPGSTRGVTFERGTLAPDYGDPDVVETISGTLADGSTVSSSVTVEGLIAFRQYIAASIAAPVFEYRMDAQVGALLTNTGSMGTATDPQMYNCATAVDTSGGFDGVVEMDSTADRVRNIFGGYPLAADILRNTDRSYIFCWENDTDVPANRYLTIATGFGTNNAWGWLQTKNAGTYNSQYLWGGGSTDLSTANIAPALIPQPSNMAGTPSSFHTTTNPDGSPRRCVCVVSYDSGAGEATIRWKTDGDGIGHTYITAPAAADTAAGAADITWMGWSSSGAADVSWRYIASVDAIVSVADMDTLCGLVLSS